MFSLPSEQTFPEGARPACVGKSELFDATDITSHHEAKALCRSCPVMARCAVLATTVESPTGTWAGRLHGRNAPSVDPDDEDAMFTTDEAREGYNAWNRGQRTPLNKIARRVHKRRLDAAREARTNGTLLTVTQARYAEEDAMFTDDEARRGATAYRYGDKSEMNALAQRVHKRRQRLARQEEGAA